MPDYNKLAVTAKNLLTKFGQDVTLVQVADGSYDPASNSFAGAGTTETTVKGARLSYTKQQVDGDIVQQGDVRLFIDAVDTPSEPSVKDKIKFGSDQWSIQDVIPLQPAATAVLYELQLRQ